MKLSAFVVLACLSGCLPQVSTPSDLLETASKDAVLPGASARTLALAGLNALLTASDAAKAQTLVDADHGEDIDDPQSVVRRLTHLASSIDKAWIAVVDGGSAYDPMVDRLVAAGVPTFRRADRALAVFGRYCRWRTGGGTDPARRP